MFVSMNGAAPSIDRSTCVSAARFSTARGPVLGEHTLHRRAIGDVRLDEGHARIVQRALETQQAAGVRELVDDDETIGGVGEACSERGSSR